MRKPLAAPEQRSLNALVGPSETLVMEQKNHAEFSAAKKALSEDFAEAYDGKMFLRNYGWIGAAVAILVAALWLAAAAVVWAEGAETKLLVLLSAAPSAQTTAAAASHNAPTRIATAAPIQP